MRGLGLFLGLFRRVPPAGPGAGVNNLLLESGDHFLLEGVGTDVLILEP